MNCKSQRDSNSDHQIEGELADHLLTTRPIFCTVNSKELMAIAYI